MGLHAVGEESAKSGRKIDQTVLKKMPVDLIASRLDEGPVSGLEDGSLLLETYDFAGQDI